MPGNFVGAPQGCQVPFPPPIPNVGIVRFYKQYIAEEHSGKMSVKMNSPKDQMDFIDKVFVGIYDPNEPEEPKDVKKEVEDDLGLVKKDEKPKSK